jgi:hypothetical protein
MKPIVKKAPKEFTNLPGNDHVTHIMVCSMHKNWGEQLLLSNGDTEDTIYWCGCCMGLCVNDDEDTCEFCG